MDDEKLIKSKERVQQHGEVFTPQWMVKKMLDVEGIKQAGSVAKFENQTRPL